MLWSRLYRCDKVRSERSAWKQMAIQPHHNPHVHKRGADVQNRPCVRHALSKDSKMADINGKKSAQNLNVIWLQQAVSNCNLSSWLPPSWSYKIQRKHNVLGCTWDNVPHLILSLLDCFVCSVLILQYSGLAFCQSVPMLCHCLPLCSSNSILL